MRPRGPVLVELGELNLSQGVALVPGDADPRPKSIRRWLPSRHKHRHKAVVLPHVILERSPVTRGLRRRNRPRRSSLAGLLSWKAPRSPFGMLWELPGWSLFVCWRWVTSQGWPGAMKQRSVSFFLRELPRPEVLDLMRSEADVFVREAAAAGWDGCVAATALYSHTCFEELKRAVGLPRVLPETPERRS